MIEQLRLAVGVMGNASSLFLYSAPILTFARVIRKRSTEEFSCVPYTLALANCYFYTWYGSPFVSYAWENITVFSVNGIGVLLELSFIFIYLWFASATPKKKVALLATSITLLFVVCTTLSVVVFHEHHYRKVFIGSIGLVASVAMYCSPLVVVKQVLQTKSVEFMPFYLSLFSFITSLFWMTYGLLSRDYILGSPNLIGCPLGILQLALYFMYRKREVMEGPQKCDVEMVEEKTKDQLQVVVISDSEAKI
ncbi:bidirectional sugar transporter SWEET3b-like [Apium graveolens]|uniref:bidirectional sugar transporter SWEET3b-like n=1 Tax=Apium graveolens TaxID=4045 RepID=UPI003D79D8ED